MQDGPEGAEQGKQPFPISAPVCIIRPGKARKLFPSERFQGKGTALKGPFLLQDKQRGGTEKQGTGGKRKMKKIMSILLAMLLTLTAGAVLAEAGEPEPIRGEVVDGSYVIRIPVEAEDTGWLALPADAETDAVRLAETRQEDGYYTVRYEPVRDGESTVAVVHYYREEACDTVLTWDLLVENGAVKEATGGSHAANAEDEEVDPYLSGSWMEKDTQFTQMTVTRNEAAGWDVEITSPMTHGAYVFTATIYQDCLENGFVYQDGEKADLTTEGNASETPSETGLTGSFVLDADENGLLLCWIPSGEEAAAVVFERADSEE